MEIFLLILIAILAIGVSTISIIAGLGGGILLIPILTVFFQLPLKTVIGSVLISLVVPAIIGTYAAIKRHEIDYKLAFLFETPTAIGAYIGALFSVSIPDLWIRSIFAGVAVILSIQMFLRVKRGENALKTPFWQTIGAIPPVIQMKTHDSEYHVSITSLAFGGLIIGFLAGILGVGGGWIKSPLMVLAFGVPPAIATGTALFMIIFTSLTGGITHLLHGSSDLSLIITLAIGLGIGATLGNILKPKFKSHQITIIIAIVLVLVSFSMLLSIFF